jgi:hypothetical protein
MNYSSPCALLSTCVFLIAFLAYSLTPNMEAVCVSETTELHGVTSQTTLVFTNSSQSLPSKVTDMINLNVPGLRPGEVKIERLTKRI